MVSYEKVKPKMAPAVWLLPREVINNSMLSEPVRGAICAFGDKENVFFEIIQLNDEIQEKIREYSPL